MEELRILLLINYPLEVFKRMDSCTHLHLGFTGHLHKFTRKNEEAGPLEDLEIYL